MNVKSVIIIALTVMLIVTTCSAITQPPCYKNIKMPEWFQKQPAANTIVNISHASNGAAMRNPDISWLKSTQIKW